MQKNIVKKGLIIAVIFPFIGSTFITIGIENVQSCGCNDPPCWPELVGKMGNNNWYVSIVYVGFNGSVDQVNYRINGGSWFIYTAPFALIDEGIHLLEWTCDNISDIYSMEIKIDTSGPYFGNFKANRIGLFKWRFSVDVFDELSGVGGVLFYITNSTDTEPPYESTIWRGCYILFCLSNFLDFLFHSNFFCPIDAWDNAGNYMVKPHAT
jgi:hypothetical protein